MSVLYTVDVHFVLYPAEALLFTGYVALLEKFAAFTSNPE